ncbi:hypothetical protein GGP41_004359 [Bipolaris sorokiniana]|uniref:Uncharacterized protein n=1 Tax=Cochliobolus sativus TaxID=45130 RepID=A0A8H6DX36_COCSA|nr:hypothetical protein GGP41_004359 [Bipolaris sorokiniana]
MRFCSSFPCDGKRVIPILLIQAQPQMFRCKTAAGTLTAFADQGYYASLCRVLWYSNAIFSWQRAS